MCKSNFGLFGSLLILVLLLASCGGKKEEKDINPNDNTEYGALAFVDLFNATKDSSVACYRIPSLITAPNGDLIAAIDERVPSCGDLKWSEDINIVLRRSSDNGNTWGDIQRIIDYPKGQSASDPSMIVDEMTNEIFMFYNFMDLQLEPNVYYMHMVKSTDNGQTWSSPIDITSQITKPDWKKDFMFITSGRGFQNANGKLLHCLVNLEKGMHVFGSDDHGDSWHLINTPISPADESKIISLENGDWMVNSRVNNSGLRYVHLSDDEGRTWSSKPDSTLIDPSCNASLIRFTSKRKGFAKNRLLFANAKSKDNRINMVVRISYDEGRTWSEGKTIFSGASAYPSLTVLENGNIGLLFEKDEYTQNVFTQFSLEWLTDGKDHLSKPYRVGE